MKHKVLISVLLTVLPFSACKEWQDVFSRRSTGVGKTTKSTPQPQFHCPMHPTYTSDTVGDCPICGMRLVPIEASEEDAEEAHGKHQGNPREKKPLFYRHPMQPGVTSPVPKKDEMGMDYVPVYPEAEQEVSAVNGRATVKLPLQKEQLIGVRTATVEQRNLTFTVRASGRVAYDPELYNTIAEYQEALKARQRIKDSPWPDVHERSEALIRSSVLRLRQLGLSEDQVRALSKDFKNPTNLLFSQPGGSVWIYAQIYEYEVGLVQVGQTMEVTTSAYPAKQFEGKIVAVDTILSAETRTIRVRALLPNPDGLLKPEMYVNARIHIDLGKRLALPEDALMDTGTRQIVFVAKRKGVFEPREVTLGHEADGYFEVIKGVMVGEEVVTSANFLIDSESKLKAAFSQVGAEHQHQ